MSVQSITGNPNFLQGVATAALTWVVYDVSLTWNREFSFIWKSSWSLSKALFIFSRYHTILALGFFLMEAIGTKHFKLPLGVGKPQPASFYAPCLANLTSLRLADSSLASRWYLGLTEVLSIMSGELMILIRINALYGWSRPIVLVTLFLFCAESVIGLTTTIISISGGAKGLFDSTRILDCHPGQANIPDVNFSMWCTSIVVVGIYLFLIIYKAGDVAHDIQDVEGKPRTARMGIIDTFRSTKMTPTLHVCLRDSAIYFVVVFCVLLVNLVLILVRNRYAQMGTPWLLATYSVASTRIFLNLKDHGEARYNQSSWSQFQQNSALDFCQVHAAARTIDDDQPAISLSEFHTQARTQIR